MRATNIDEVRSGQWFSLNCRDLKTNQPKSVHFMVIVPSWFPSPSPNHRGVFYKGAMVISAEGQVAILDFISMMFCEEVLALPAPCKH